MVNIKILNWKKILYISICGFRVTGGGDSPLTHLSEIRRAWIAENRVLFKCHYFRRPKKTKLSLTGRIKNKIWTKSPFLPIILFYPPSPYLKSWNRPCMFSFRGTLSLISIDSSQRCHRNLFLINMWKILSFY